MIFMNKYKEQMNKISVDNDMKRRIIDNVKKSQTEKIKKSIFNGQTFYKYGGFMVACCAFVVTYVTILNYPEIISEKDMSLNDSQYSLKNQENENLESEYNDDVSKNNDFIEEKSEGNSEVRDKKVEDINRDENVNNGNQKNISSYDSSEETQKVNTEKDNIISKDIKEESNLDDNKSKDIKEESNVDDNRVNDNLAEEEINNKNQDTDIQADDDKKLKIASYEENSINNSYFQYSVPDLSKYGFNMIYLNHISKNEAEIMYSNNEINVFIKIFEKEDNIIENNYNIISYVEYNGKEVVICTDNEKNIQTIVYLKDNYFYCISSNINMDKNFVNKILEYI